MKGVMQNSQANPLQKNSFAGFNILAENLLKVSTPVKGGRRV